MIAHRATFVVLAALTSNESLGLTGLAFGALILSLGLVSSCGYRALKTYTIKLGSRMGQASWDFSSSFATNITIIGSVLTIILTSNALTNATQIFPANAYGGLAIFFGILVLVAPLFYNGTAIRVKVASADEFDTAAEYHGTVWGFLLAATMTAWGLVGSVATVLLTLIELERQGSLPLAVVVLLGVTLGVTVLLFARYLWVRIEGTIVNEFDPETRAAREQRVAATRAATASRALAPAKSSTPSQAAAEPDQSRPPPSPRFTLL